MTGVLLPTAAPVSPEVVGFLTNLAVALHKQRAYPPSHPMRPTPGCAPLERNRERVRRVAAGDDPE